MKKECTRVRYLTIWTSEKGACIEDSAPSPYTVEGAGEPRLRRASMKCGNFWPEQFSAISNTESVHKRSVSVQRDREGRMNGGRGGDGRMDQVPIKHIVSRITVTWNSCSHCQGGNFGVSKLSGKVWDGCWGWILGRNWDKILKSFPPCYSHSHLYNGF